MRKLTCPRGWQTSGVNQSLPGLSPRVNTKHRFTKHLYCNVLRYPLPLSSGITFCSLQFFSSWPYHAVRSTRFEAGNGWSSTGCCAKHVLRSPVFIVCPALRGGPQVICCSSKPQNENSAWPVQPPKTDMRQKQWRTLQPPKMGI